MTEFRDDNFFDTDDVKGTEKQEKEKLAERMKHLDDIRWVLSNAKGRRFIWWLICLCGSFRIDLFVAKDSSQTAFNLGRRDIGLRILEDVQSSNPKSYSQMEDEFRAERIKNKKGDS